PGRRRPPASGPRPRARWQTRGSQHVYDLRRHALERLRIADGADAGRAPRVVAPTGRELLVVLVQVRLRLHLRHRRPFLLDHGRYVDEHGRGEIAELRLVRLE